MKILRGEPFKRDLQSLPEDAQRRAEKAIRLLTENPRHPSLRARKMKGLEDIWEASVSMSYRITYQIQGDTLISPAHRHTRHSASRGCANVSWQTFGSAPEPWFNKRLADAPKFQANFISDHEKGKL